jgi:two-component system response regulator AtoC
VRNAKRVIEQSLIRRALEQTGGNRTRAARLLEMSHRGLLNKLREYGMDDL